MEFIAGLSFFWVGLLFGLFSLIAIISVATKSYGWAFMAIIAGIAFTHLTAFSAVDWLQMNWWYTAKLTSAYIALGLIWATFAWFIHTIKRRQRYDDIRRKLLPRFLETEGATELTPALHLKFRGFMEAHGGREGTASLDATISKSVMVEQVILWPFKLISFFLGDAIKYTVDLFVSMFGGMFKRINKWVFRNFPELHT